MEKTYNIIINGTDYSGYLQLPFSVNLRADEAYNSAALVLNRTRLKDPFPIYTPLTIKVYNSVVSYTYAMIIEEDTVDTIYRTGKPYYTHNITCIEKTKLLDNIILPSFTITNPATKSSISVGEYGKWEQTEVVEQGGGIPSTSDYEDYGLNDNQLKNYSIKIEAKVNNDLGYGLVDLTSSKLAMYGGWRSKYGINTSTKFNLRVPLTKTFDLQVPTTQHNPFAYQCVMNIWQTGSGVDDWYTWAASIGTATAVGAGLGALGGGIGAIPGAIVGFISGAVAATGLNTAIPFNSYTSTNDVDISIPTITEYYYRTSSDNTDVYKIIGYTLSEQKTGKVLNHKVVDSARFKVDSIPKYISVQEETVTVGCRIVIPGKLYDDLYQEWYGTRYIETILKEAYRALSRKHESNSMFTPHDSIDLARELGLVDKMDSTEENKNIASNAIAKYVFDNSSYSTLVSGDLRAYSTRFEIPLVCYAGEEEGEPVYESGYKTIESTLNKIMNLIPPEYKYTIADMPNYILKREVSERVYSDKTVSEVLFDLGKIIECYPELTDDNKIVFNELKPIDNLLFDDSTEDESLTSNSDNSTTSYISDIKNVISTPNSHKEQYSYWPSRYKFAPPNGTGENYLSTPDTTGIVLDSTDSMYYLKYIKVKNCCKSITLDDGSVISANTVVDLTPFCHEKTYYETLQNKMSANSGYLNYSKNNCIYWEKGKNRIYLEELEAQTKVAILGSNDPTTYKIHNAILCALRAQFPNSTDLKKSYLAENPTQFQYQICYINNMNTRVRTEKFTVESDINIEDNYNQETNTISSENWMNTSQVNILRRGNKDKSKNVKINNISHLPSLGESMATDSRRYFADNINLSFDNNYILCSMNYTQDYNKINRDVALSKEYRQYEIYGEAAVDRYISINRYCYLSTEKDENAINSNIKFTKQLVPGERIQTPSIAVVYFKDKNKELIKYNKVTAYGGIDKKTTTGLIIPLTYISGGNSFLLKGQMADNFAAGYYADQSSTVEYMPILSTSDSAPLDGARLMTEARYVDDLGEAEYMSIYIINPGTGEGNSNESTIIDNSIYPQTSISEADIVNYALDYETDIQISKDNRERICFTYQYHFLSKNPLIKWHPAMTKYLFFDQEHQNSLFTKETDENTIESKYSPTIYAFKQDTLVSSTVELEEKVVVPTINVSEESITANTTFVSKNGTRNFALVYPKTAEPIFHLSKWVQPEFDYTLPTIYFNHYKTKQ